MAIKIKIISAAVLFSICASFCHALTNYYVVPPPNAGILPPYTNWTMAATNIQDVITIALGGDTIFVTNGHYYLTTYINVNKGVIIRSFNNGITDPTNTIIDGNNYVGKLVTNRCLYITTTATVDGLTLTNGSGSSIDSSGGGCYISSYGLLTNCIIIGNFTTNAANGLGGGIYANGTSTVANCQIIANRSSGSGGGLFVQDSSVIKNSLIGWNSTANGVAGAMNLYGGMPIVFNCDIVSNIGPYCVYFGGSYNVISNCVIRGHSASSVIDHQNSTRTNNLVTHCQIINNTSAAATVIGYLDGVIYRNCLIANNKTTSVAGFRVDKGVIDIGGVESCTIVSNYAGASGGAGFWFATGCSNVYVINTIICSNQGVSPADILFSEVTATNFFTNSCCKTVSLPSAQGNIQSDPLFVDVNSGNYRLASGSPCINRGTIQNWMTNAFDLDGRHRLNVLNGLVDMGCYEYIPAGTMFICK